MRVLYLTTMIFCHILLSSFILYSSLASASPVAEHPNKPAAVAEPPKHVDVVVKPKEELQQPIQYAAAAAPKVEQQQQPQLYKPEVQKIESVTKSKDSLVPKSAAKDFKVEPSVEEPKSAVAAVQQVQQQQQRPAKSSEEKLVARKDVEPVPEKKAVVVEPAQPKVYESAKSEMVSLLSDSIQEKLVAESPVVVKQHAAPAIVPAAPVKEVKYPVVVAAAAPEQAVSKPVVSPKPVVKGGLGPLHLLAATLCSYQPHKPVSDETLTYLYNQRAAQRKSLFQFMSLKFTNLDKLTSHLNAGLEPTKTVDSSESSIVRSHGWPVVGNCTAHYLKLMAEAAWCDCADEPHCLRDVPEVKLHQPRLSRRSADQQQQEQIERSSSVMSKLMYVGDVKDAPVVAEVQKSAVQPATVASTRQCRRNALRLAKALFNHLAENQTEVSESWPKLHAELAHDECARKRMIDIVTALSTFRSESTQVHRDNIEFAFAMDDLRGKVLENEVSVPLTFDKQVIEVEQFLQQSVRLMLANIDPKRAKLTSMRYRSLHAPVSADDQCIELHQRLLAKNYPDECNPNQYGPLPDVLRMAALSLDLWSIEQDLSKYSAPSQMAPKQQEINECIANLVAN